MCDGWAASKPLEFVVRGAGGQLWSFGRYGCCCLRKCLRKEKGEQRKERKESRIQHTAQNGAAHRKRCTAQKNKKQKKNGCEQYRQTETGTDRERERREERGERLRDTHTHTHSHIHTHRGQRKQGAPQRKTIKRLSLLTQTNLVAVPSTKSKETPKKQKDVWIC